MALIIGLFVLGIGAIIIEFFVPAGGIIGALGAAVFALEESNR